jgi:hypothetical protein
MNSRPHRPIEVMHRTACSIGSNIDGLRHAIATTDADLICQMQTCRKPEHLPAPRTLAITTVIGFAVHERVVVNWSLHRIFQHVCEPLHPRGDGLLPTARFRCWRREARPACRSNDGPDARSWAVLPTPRATAPGSAKCRSFLSNDAG